MVFAHVPGFSPFFRLFPPFSTFSPFLVSGLRGPQRIKENPIISKVAKSEGALRGGGPGGGIVKKKTLLVKFGPMRVFCICLQAECVVLAEAAE